MGELQIRLRSSRNWRFPDCIVAILGAKPVVCFSAVPEFFLSQA